MTHGCKQKDKGTQEKKAGSTADNADELALDFFDCGIILLPCPEERG